MIQLRPGEQFVIVRQLDDPTDTTTYFVRAVVRNLSDDTVLETINLTDNGSRRFSKAWSVISDNTGDGRWISITTTVYTDSGYTTKSDNYREQAETYLVQERWNPFKHRNLFGGGADIDYKRIRKIISEEVAQLGTEEAVKEIVGEILTPALKQLQTLSQSIRDASKAAEHVADDLQNIDFENRMEKIGKEIKMLFSQIKIPEPKEPKEPDLTPLTGRVDRIIGTLSREIARVEQAHKTIENLGAIEASTSAIAEVTGNLENELRDFIYAWHANKGMGEAKQKSFRGLAETLL